jgi:hypothetical protein
MRNKMGLGWLKLVPGLLAAGLCPLIAQDQQKSTSISESLSRLSDEAVPLRLEGYPERPKPLFEWGDKLLGPGNLKPGFTLPTGANWSPAFWIFGNYRTTIQSYDPGYAPRTTEWANRLDLFANLQLAGLERALVGFRPIDRFRDGSDHFSGYNFEPHQPANLHGWQDEWRATPTTFFFEGELGEIFPSWSKGDTRNMDYGFSIGRQPLVLQDGLLVEDDSIDMFGVTRNTLLGPGIGAMRLTGLFAWDEIDRADNREDRNALFFALDTEIDLDKVTIEGTAIYIPSDRGGDGFYTGFGASRQFGKFHTVFRIANSVAIEGESSRVRNGTLLFSEISFDPEQSRNLVYLNTYFGIDHFSSAVRAPTVGGPLARGGLLTAAPGIGRYGSGLSSYPDRVLGASVGYQMYFGPIPRTHLILELGGRLPTNGGAPISERESYGVAARFQKAFGRRFILVMDSFGVMQHGKEAIGGRVEWLTKF